MDDKFLYENRPPVRNGFAENLYARLASNPFQNRRPSLRTAAIRFVFAAMMVFAITFATTGPVGASVRSWIRQVAGLEVQESDSLPAAENEINLPPGAVDTLARIRKELPYEFSLPTYVPYGFVFADNVEVQGQSVFMQWTNENKDEILMQVDLDHGQRYLTGKDAAQEIQIKGQPTMLFQGGYDLNHNWDPSIKMTNLLLRRDNVIYWLIYVKNPEGIADNTAAQDEIIRMMSSIIEDK